MPITTITSPNPIMGSWDQGEGEGEGEGVRERGGIGSRVREG
jgi:hypothetical protein